MEGYLHRAVVLRVVGPYCEDLHLELPHRCSRDGPVHWRCSGKRPIEGEALGQLWPDLPGAHVSAVGGADDRLYRLIYEQKLGCHAVDEEYLGVVYLVQTVAQAVPVPVLWERSGIQSTCQTVSLFLIPPAVVVIVRIGLIGIPIPIGVKQPRGYPYCEMGPMQAVVSPDCVVSEFEFDAGGAG